MTAKSNTVKVRRTTDTNVITFTLGASGSAVQFIKMLATEANELDIVKRLNSITGINHIDIWADNVDEKCYLVPVEISFNYRENGLDMSESRELAKLKELHNMAANVANATNAELNVILVSMGVDVDRLNALESKKNAEGEKRCSYMPPFDVRECSDYMRAFIEENGDKVLGKL